MELEDRVLEILSEAKVKVAEAAAIGFEGDTRGEIEDLRIDSPIERALYVALKSTMRFNGDEEADIVEINGNVFTIGIDIKPQFSIGKYRVDFLVINHRREEQSRQVVVECDSQSFHDRTEQERRYEKKRDRDMQRLGYRVFRFTGAEILKNPFAVAKEILEYVYKGDKNGLD